MSAAAEPNPWRTLAWELASALEAMPCTCIKKSQPWPPVPVEHVDKTCRRCSTLNKFHDASKAAQ